MSNTRSNKFRNNDEPRVKEVRKGVDKSNKHRKRLYNNSSGTDTDGYDDYDSFDTQRKY